MATVTNFLMTHGTSGRGRTPSAVKRDCWGSVSLDFLLVDMCRKHLCPHLSTIYVSAKCKQKTTDNHVNSVLFSLVSPKPLTCWRLLPFSKLGRVEGCAGLCVFGHFRLPAAPVRVGRSAGCVPVMARESARSKECKPRLGSIMPGSGDGELLASLHRRQQRFMRLYHS